MSPPAVRFRYERRASAVFGAIRRPVALAHLYSPPLHRWIGYTMVVDTGADYCVLPASVAVDLGIALGACEPQSSSGIGGPQKVFFYRTARMRLGPWELRVPVGFVDREDLPPLLGRFRCLDRFDLRLRESVTTFSALPHGPPSRTTP